MANGFRNCRLTYDIAGVGADYENVAAELCACRFNSRRVYTGDGDAGALSKEPTGCFQPDAARTASNERA